jgi:hypothetical protein
MIDGSADIKQNDKTDGRGREEQGNSFLSGLLQEALDGIATRMLMVETLAINPIRLFRIQISIPLVLVVI